MSCDDEKEQESNTHAPLEIVADLLAHAEVRQHALHLGRVLRPLHSLQLSDDVSLHLVRSAALVQQTLGKQAPVVLRKDILIMQI